MGCSALAFPAPSPNMLPLSRRTTHRSLTVLAATVAVLVGGKLPVIQNDYQPLYGTCDLGAD